MSDIILRSGKTTACIRQKGAEMISFCGADGREVIWQADPAVWGKHAPILFPICGRAKDDMAIIDGVTYPMERHGFVRTAPFEIARIGEDFVDLIITPTEASKPQFPFDFVFHVVYTLRENGFRTDFIVENKSQRVMPFCIGGHPAFALPMQEGEKYTDYRIVFPCVEEGKSLLLTGDGLIRGHEIIPLENGTTLPLKHDWFDARDTLIFPELNSNYADLVHCETGKGLRFSYHKMEVLAVWSMPRNHGDYVCIEPWHGLPGLADESGRFVDKPYATLLSPGMSFQCGYDVALI